ncbi:MAG: type IVB secretion system apparatus protein IcmL/DotI [Gammaproteobacteria bacterium]|nr:type IVB secretion system apparatus protein IcmL/DotI [Gammaproteobacteria bacterium]
MANGSLELVKLRSDFYKDNFRRMVWVLLISLVLNLILACSVIFFSHQTPRTYYFATTSDGRLIPVQPLSNPNMSDVAVTNWVSNNLPQIYALDFVHYRTQLQNMQGSFTDFGWQQFMQASAGFLGNIVNQQLITSATLTNVPIIVQKGLINGVYSWQVQVPLLIATQKGDQQSTQNVIVRMIVQRVNNIASQQLLGISQIVQQNQGS